MLFNHLAVRIITVIISAVVCPIAFNTQFIFIPFPIFRRNMSFFKKRVGFVNNCPMKPAVVNQPLIKFGMFNFAVSHSVCFLFFFSVNGRENQICGYLMGQHKNREQFSKGGATQMKLQDRGKQVLIKKALDSTHKENIKKTSIADSSIAVSLPLRNCETVRVKIRH